MSYKYGKRIENETAMRELNKVLLLLARLINKIIIDSN